jgi:serine/threonine-protein kinase
MDKQKLGHYELKDELGRGGMGVVYKAYDPTLSRDVAIKVLSEALAHDSGVVERFIREARSMAALNDTHIIQIYFIGEDEGAPYFAMEYVEGESLSQRLKRDGSVVPSEACRIIRETAQGLALAHSKGVIHRDIKPGNLMLSSGDKIKIADFGIAMVQDMSERLTNTGEFVGTPGYLSPEVCVGQPVDHRSDIFALGIVFFEMLTGRIPFTESSPLGMMLEVVKADIPDVRSINAEVDERTCNILKRMIAKDPEQRYQSCEELIVDLASNQPVSAPGTFAPSAASSEFQHAATTALSQLEALPELADQISTPPSAPQAPAPAAEKPAAAKGSNALPIAIAAAMMMAIGAGSLYLFRDTIRRMWPIDPGST